MDDEVSALTGKVDVKVTVAIFVITAPVPSPDTTPAVTSGSSVTVKSCAFIVAVIVAGGVVFAVREETIAGHRLPAIERTSAAKSELCCIQSHHSCVKQHLLSWSLAEQSCFTAVASPSTKNLSSQMQLISVTAQLVFERLLAISILFHGSISIPCFESWA